MDIFIKLKDFRITIGVGGICAENLTGQRNSYLLKGVRKRKIFPPRHQYRPIKNDRERCRISPDISSLSVKHWFEHQGRESVQAEVVEMDNTRSSIL